MLAIRRGWQSRRKSLNEQELPSALLASMMANQNRDPKKQKKGFTYKDFQFYADTQNEDRPSARYGSAAIELVKADKFPAWALFCFPQLKESADPSVMPARLAFFAEDAMLLAPIQVKTGWAGLLIARESASECTRIFKDEEGNEFRLTLPYIETKIVAREGVTLF